MITGDYQGERLGACTDCRHFWRDYRAGALDSQEISAVEDRLCATTGTCMVMGTASTMAALAEALGMMLPGGASPPAVMADRRRQRSDRTNDCVNDSEESSSLTNFNTQRL